MQDKKAPLSTSSILSDAHLYAAARLFTVLSEPSRLLLLRELMAAPLNVSALVAQTGLKQGTVSKHLGILLEARIVQRTRSGMFVRYRLADPTVKQLCRIVCQRTERDAQNRLTAFSSDRAAA